MAEYLPNPPIPGLNPNANSSGPAEGVAILMIIVTIVMVALRFTARTISPGLGLDDWLMLWASVCLESVPVCMSISLTVLV